MKPENFILEHETTRIEINTHTINQKYLGLKYILVWKDRLCTLHEHGQTDYQIAEIIKQNILENV